MTTTMKQEIEQAAPRPPSRRQRVIASSRLLAFLAETEHQSIGLRIVLTALAFFAAAGVLALLMRLQLARPEHSPGADARGETGGPLLDPRLHPVGEPLALAGVPAPRDATVAAVAANALRHVRVGPERLGPLR